MPARIASHAFFSGHPLNPQVFMQTSSKNVKGYVHAHAECLFFYMTRKNPWLRSPQIMANKATRFCTSLVPAQCFKICTWRLMWNDRRFKKTIIKLTTQTICINSLTCNEVKNGVTTCNIVAGVTTCNIVASSKCHACHMRPPYKDDTTNIHVGVLTVSFPLDLNTQAANAIACANFRKARLMPWSRRGCHISNRLCADLLTRTLFSTQAAKTTRCPHFSMSIVYA